MATVTVSKQVDASVQDVWATWEDFGNIYKFNPVLKHSHLLSDSSEPTGVGSERHCDMADSKNWVRERVIDYRPLKSIKIDVFDGSMPLKSMIATFSFRKINEQKTAVQMQVEFEPKFGVLGKMMTPMMNRQFRPMLQSLLDCNAAHVERGDVVAAAA
jgi:ribosome-associated toxin RatA of RatAB toxin-antitoxin module